MAFAELLEQVGSTGRFQVIHVTLLSIPILMLASHNLLQNFVALVPPHYCNAHQNLSLSRLSPEKSLQVTVPLDENRKPEKCRRYVSPQWNLLDQNFSLEEKGLNPDLQGCIDGWTYNITVMTSTIISEWDLVCDLRSLKQMGQTIYMGGFLVGAGIFGHLSDRFGRRFLLLTSHLMMAVGGTCASFSLSFPVFCLCRFVCGMAVSGIMINTLSLMVEWIPTRTRSMVGAGMGYFYTFGQLILVLFAYFVRDWRRLTLAVSVPFYAFFLYSWWILESARWLILNKKSQQAVKNLKTVARINGRREEGHKIDLEMMHEAMKKELLSSQGSRSALDLFRIPIMRIMTICLSAVWFSTSFAYYGLAMDLQKFGVDIFLIQVIFGAVDIPAKFIITVSMGLIGRRPSQSAALIFAGAMILINLLVPYEQQTLRTSLAVLGKGGLAASFNCCILYSGELYPTVLRQSGMGLVCVMGRLGAMVAPMVLLIGNYVTWLPGVIYGGAPILSGVAALFLPETLNIPLPDTVQDVEDRGSGRKSKRTPKQEVMFLQDAADSVQTDAA